MCLKCKESWREVIARGLCARCYVAVSADGTRDDYPLTLDGAVNFIVCRSCRWERKHKARGLCGSCHSKHSRVGDLGRFPLTLQGRRTVGVEIVDRKPRTGSVAAQQCLVGH